MTISEFLKIKDLSDAPLDVKADAIGVSPVTLWRILNGKTGVSSRTVATIEKKTKGAVTFHDLANGASTEAR